METLSIFHKSADLKTVGLHKRNNKSIMCARNKSRMGQSHPGSEYLRPSLIATFFQLLSQAAIKNLRVRNKNKQI